jgi:hypothetical protein
MHDITLHVKNLEHKNINLSHVSKLNLNCTAEFFTIKFFQNMISLNYISIIFLLDISYQA